MNTNDPYDEHSSDCAVCGLSLDDKSRDKRHSGIHEDCNIEDYRSQAQQIVDSYVDGQLKQCRAWIDQMSLEGFICDAFAEDDISDSMLLEILKSQVRRA
jgi:hypothetical protein